MAREWDPFHDMKRLPDLINKRIDKLISGYKKPFSNIRQGIDSVSVEVKLPGIEKKDIALDVDYTRVIIRTGNGKRKGSTGDKYFRAIYLPSGLSIEKAKATFTDGLLRVAIPKDKKSVRVKIK